MKELSFRDVKIEKTSWESIDLTQFVKSVDFEESQISFWLHPFQFIKNFIQLQKMKRQLIDLGSFQISISGPLAPSLTDGMRVAIEIDDEWKVGTIENWQCDEDGNFSFNFHPDKDESVS